ncbi:hypothetical protein EV424DRAFT_1545766 [Suillus variegatus]|nr:hypothetical protein EV424DRAFT_1545766 [Suillus variegatus]
MEDGVKAELFQFIPPEEHELMNYQSFGSQFGRGISNAHSEMASDVKVCAGAIFSLSVNIFIWGYKRHKDPGCRALLLSPHGDYMKFVPVFFPTSKKLVPTGASVESIALRQIITGCHRCCIFEDKAISLLSGDAELTEIGETTKIPYRKYHNFFRQRLLTGGSWAHQVFLFFNNALFSTSSSVPPPANDNEPGHMYEEEFERAMEQELKGLVFNADVVGLLLPNPWTIHIPHDSLLSDSEDEAHPKLSSHSSHYCSPTCSSSFRVYIYHDGGLNLGPQDAHVEIEHLGPMEIDNACPKPKPKPKPRRKAQTADNLVIGEDLIILNHTILDLIEHAEKEWDAKLTCTSKTLPEAVAPTSYGWLSLIDSLTDSGPDAVTVVNGHRCQPEPTTPMCQQH